jgi:hypothetical protein
MTPHLNHEQLCDLLLASSPQGTHESRRLELLRQHLRECNVCAAELASLNESLTVFRSAATAWSSSEWNRAEASTRSLRHAPARPRSLIQAVLWTAAAALVIAATLPFALHRTPPATPRTPAAVVHTAPPSNISDEALLEEVNETLSSSIPSPMQPLDDPTAGRPNQSNNQRKN